MFVSSDAAFNGYQMKPIRWSIAVSSELMSLHDSAVPADVFEGSFMGASQSCDGDYRLTGFIRHGYT